MVLLQHLAIVEGWIYDGDYKGALLTKQQIIDRLEYAKLAGYIDRTIVLYAQMCPKGEEHPGGLTVQVIPTPSYVLDRISPIFPRFPPFFARFHRLAEAVPTSRKPEPRAKRQWQGRPNTVSAA